MPLLEWNDQLSVHVAEMDSHHKKLINIINKLHDAIQNNQENQIVSKIILELIQYTKYHFIAEESLMSKYNYPLLEQQKKTHAVFIDNAWSYLNDLHNDTATIGHDMLIFLKDWLYNHIIKVDMQYKEYFDQRGLETTERN